MNKYKNFSRWVYKFPAFLKSCVMPYFCVYMCFIEVISTSNIWCKQPLERYEAPYLKTWSRKEIQKNSLLLIGRQGYQVRNLYALGYQANFTLKRPFFTNPYKVNSNTEPPPGPTPHNHPHLSDIEYISRQDEANYSKQPRIHSPFFG